MSLVDTSVLCPRVDVLVWVFAVVDTAVHDPYFRTGTTRTDKDRHPAGGRGRDGPGRQEGPLNPPPSVDDREGGPSRRVGEEGPNLSRQDPRQGLLEGHVWGKTRVLRTPETAL